MVFSGAKLKLHTFLKRRAQPAHRSRSLVPFRHVFQRWFDIGVGISARNTGWRSGGDRRGQEHRTEDFKRGRDQVAISSFAAALSRSKAA